MIGREAEREREREGNKRHMTYIPVLIGLTVH